MYLPNNWIPRPYQHSLWSYFEEGGKRASAIWHRRAGKDDLCLHLAAVKSQERIGNYWHMLPLQNQVRRAIWDAINPHTGIRRIDEAFPYEMRETTREQEMMIRFKNGSTWNAIGSDAYNSLVGSPPVGLVYSEWALSDPNSWGYLRPILRENGGWAAFISTPRGENHAFRTHQLALKDPAWFGETLTANDTSVFSDQDLEEELAEYIAEYGEDLGTAMFEQEYLCSFEAAIVGAYYSKELRDAKSQGRITQVPYDPSRPVETWWDLGVRDQTAVWYVQRTPANVRVIEYEATIGEGLPQWRDRLEAKPYTYSRHIGPHDIDHREWGTAVSRKKTALGMGIKFEATPNLPRADGIHAVRTILPMCYFDEEKCADGLDCLRNYRAQWDPANRILSANPVHDWASHGADAFRTGAITFPAGDRATDWSKPTGRNREGRWNQPTIGVSVY